MKKYIGLSLILLSVIMLLVGLIPIKTSKTITYKNVIYKNEYIYNDVYKDIDIITLPENRSFEIFDEVKRPSDESGYVFLALIVGLVGFLITKAYLNHNN